MTSIPLIQGLRQLEGASGAPGFVLPPFDPSAALLIDALTVDGLAPPNWNVVASPPDQLANGKLRIGKTAKPLGFIDLDLQPPGPDLAFTVFRTGGKGFRLAIDLGDTPLTAPLFKFASRWPGHVLKVANEQTNADGEAWLEPTGEDAVLWGAGLFLVIKSDAGEPARLSLSTSQPGPDGVITLQVGRPGQPAPFVLGATGFGLSLPGGITFDDSGQAAAPDVSGPFGADPGWHGLAATGARLYLPKDAPFLGGRAVDQVDFSIGIAPTPGIRLQARKQIQGKPGSPAIDVLVACDDPEGRGLADLVPTLAEASVTLPAALPPVGIDGVGTATPAGSKPVVLRARFARDPKKSPPQTQLSLSVEANGPDGILAVRQSGGNPASKVMVTGAVLATILAAEHGAQQPGGDETGIVLAYLLGVATGLSAFLADNDAGRVVLHGVELDGDGSLPPVDRIRLKLDYSVDVVVTTFSAGPLSVGMSPNQPMRVRVRDVHLDMDRSKSGLDRFHLGFDSAAMEVEDPGGWKVQSPGSIFDILGTRSGRGSLWYEVDLRFKLDLGPIKVSGATIRATLGSDGKPVASLRGLDASLDVGPVTGRGKVELTPGPDPNAPAGFKGLLAATIEPLDLSVQALVELNRPMVMLELLADLPGPIPIANTGLGLFSIGGLLAANGRPVPPKPGVEPVGYWLGWSPEGGFQPLSGVFGIGLEAVLGTAPDMGFSFSSAALVTIVTPDLAAIGALNARLLGPRRKLADRTPGADIGPQLKGVIVVDPNDGVTAGAQAQFNIPGLIELNIPLGVRFPRENPSHWYLRLGGDGYAGGAGPPRPPPARAVLLPGTFQQEADGYVMIEGAGLPGWPPGGGLGGGLPDQFVVAVGFACDLVVGVRHVLWAEIAARADVAICPSPLLLLGKGSFAGSLNLAFVSLGVSADLAFVLGDQDPPWIKAHACGRIKLLWCHVKKCVSVEWGSHRTSWTAPDVTDHILQRREGTEAVLNVAFSDDGYHGAMSMDGQGKTSAVQAGTSPANAPTVWPDAIPILGFSSPPYFAPPSPPDPTPQFPGLFQYPEGDRVRAKQNDSLSYRWDLLGLKLVEVTEHADGSTSDIPVPGQFSLAWQRGRSGDAGATPQPAELALFTPDPSLWVNRTADGKAVAGYDPLQQDAQICRLQAAASAGWALGASAVDDGAGELLPPEAASADPLQSVFWIRIELSAEPHVAKGWSELLKPLSAATAMLLPPPYAYRPSVPQPASPVTTRAREFPGWLTLGGAWRPPGAQSGPFIASHADLVADDDLIEAEVWLLADAAISVTVESLVNDKPAGAWSAAPPGSSAPPAICFRPPSKDPVRALRVSWPLDAQVRLLGVRGVTAKASAAAAARNSAQAAQAAAQAAQAKQVAAGPSARCVLWPGKLYRIDVELNCTATFKPDPNGPAVPSDTKSKPLPFFFRTATLDPPPTAIQTGPSFWTLLRERAWFDPAMLQRHVLGYEPGQAETDRFRDDPLAVHFAVGHVPVLADRYGYDVALRVRRTDRVRLEAQPAGFNPSWGALELGADALKNAFGAAAPAFDPSASDLTAQLAAVRRDARSRLLPGAGARRFELAETSPCPFPTPGATLAGQASLEPQAWYELYVALDARPGSHAASGRLPGVSFRTSRWRGPGDMLAGLDFAIDGTLGSATGDIALTPQAAARIASLAAATPSDSDATFDAALEQLGLGGWPVASSPRISLLWARELFGWMCAGAMIESPEPIDRPCRCGVAGLSLRMQAELGAPITFSLHRDRTASRILAIAARPFRPVGAPFKNLQSPHLELDLLEWTAQDLAALVLSPPTVIQGRLGLPSQPAFAEDAR